LVTAASSSLTLREHTYSQKLALLFPSIFLTHCLYEFLHMDWGVVFGLARKIKISIYQKTFCKHINIE
jgi:hypothetical protein